MGLNAKAVGKIAGGLGLVLVLTSPFTLLTTSSAGFAAAKALLGAGLLGIYVATNGLLAGRAGLRRSAPFAVSSVALVVLLLAALVGLNIAAAKRNQTWDLTRRKLNSLSPQSVSTLQGLDYTARAIAFLPAQSPAYADVEELFAQYHREAPERFQYQLVDPAKNPALAAEHQVSAGQVAFVVARENGARTRLQGFSEQELTNALIRLSGAGERRAYFVSGHGEWALPSALEREDRPNRLTQLVRSLEKDGYAPTPLHLAGRTEIPRDASLLVFVGTKSALAASELAMVRSYLDQGGRVLYFAEPNVESGLDALLAEYGVQLDPGTVADDKFTAGSPYVLLSVFYSEHPISHSLLAAQLTVELGTARAITLLREGARPGVVAEPVVLSSPSAWEETAPTESPSASPGEKTGQLVLVSASRRPVEASAGRRFADSRLVVFGDSDLLLDGTWGGEANRNLVLNAFAWASERGATLEIRPPDREISTIQLDDQRLSRIRFITTDLFPLSLLAVGLVVWLSRRNR